jgi:hypothetical protein
MLDVVMSYLFLIYMTTNSTTTSFDDIFLLQLIL